MLRRMRIAYLILYLLLWLPLAQASDAYHARYEVRVDGIKVGEMERTFTHNDGYYSLTTDAYTTGAASLFSSHRVVEMSIWQEVDGQERPERFSYMKGETTLERGDFDWLRKQVHYLRDGKSRDLPLEVGMVDRLTVQHRLQQDLKQLSEPRGVLAYKVVEKAKVRDYIFQIHGEERVETPHGHYKAIKIERLSKNKKRKTFFWCAPELGYLPIRILQDDDGHTYESSLLNTTIQP